MKILIIHNKYQSNNIGGEDIVYENELYALKQKLGNENVYSFEVSNDNINKLALLYNIWFNKTYYKKIYNLVKENDINIVHVHNFYPLLTPSIFKAAKDAGAKVIHTLHNYRLWCISGIFYRSNYGICELCTNQKFSFQGIINKCYRKSFLQSIVAQLSFWYYKKITIFDNIDYYFVLTRFQQHKVEKLGINKNKIILKPNSVNIKNLNISYDKKNDYYIYVGRLEESKGIIQLLSTWEKLNNSYKLIVVGGGELKQILKNKYKKFNNIIFKGKQNREDTIELISKAKYLIQPSLLYETFGLTIIEAMIQGTPVIGFDIGTRKDFIVDGVNGFLASNSNLKDVIEKSFQCEEYEKLTKNAILTAKQFENNCIIEKQIIIYKKIIGNVI